MPSNNPFHKDCGALLANSPFNILFSGSKYQSHEKHPVFFTHTPHRGLESLLMLFYPCTHDLGFHNSSLLSYQHQVHHEYTYLFM